ncbi:MAG TPA: glucoamylase family protein [Candidatus Dormibacteraeota bacterium]|nr:glucoamylase family protein [Candidatus Dormibacteraeota bacterium]
MRATLSRRAWLQRASRMAAAFPLVWPSSGPLAFLQNSQRALNALPPPGAELAQLFENDPTKYRFTRAENAFLEELQQISFKFFWNETNPATGLVKDRSRAEGSDQRNAASIAATGFGLTALCIADQREWEDKTQVRDRVRATLRFVARHVPHERGFFSHFLNIQTGERVFQSEVSSIDTAIFLCGVLTCRGYFDDAEIHDLSTQLYERVDWSWMLHDKKTISMGWKPERGFIKTRWDSYSELMMLYLLSLGSSTHPLPPEAWSAWSRPTFEFNGIRYIGAHAPLFAHQYSHAWFDFRAKRDKFADYFVNSVIATKVHKLWCLELSQQFPDYSEDLWGISASDSTRGYTAWGGPPVMGRIDGSVVPCASAGSLPFLPEETLHVLQAIREKFGKKAWRNYGFVDAFNPLTNWYSPDVLGIDVGITILMAENARTGFVWEHFMKNEEAKRGMTRAGFRPIPPAENS